MSGYCSASGPALTSCLGEIQPQRPRTRGLLISAGADTAANSDGPLFVQGTSRLWRRRPLRLCRQIAGAALGLGKVSLHLPVVGTLLMYNPDTAPEVFGSAISKQFPAAAPGIEAALANATSIAEIITTAHLPSAANEGFSPEYYSNQSIVDGSKPSSYSDTPAPKMFGNVSPLTRNYFQAFNEFVAEVLKHGPGSTLRSRSRTGSMARPMPPLSHLSQAERQVHDQNSWNFVVPPLT